MASLFDHTPLPLWVWIVIIAVGSLVILGTTAFAIRFCIVRRREADFVDTFGDDDLPQRKVTVRRGRVVEHSRYLSLTGSKFGLNAFGADDNDAQSRAGARSKSPFEWWSTVKDRSQSRNSQLTLSVHGDASSIYSGPPSPGLTRMYQRKDFNHSNTSLSSTIKDASVTMSETTTEPPPAIVRNFSRSFARPAPYSKFSPRQQQTLSRIEESSPHNSMVSTRQSRIASFISNKSKRDTKSSTTSSMAHSPAIASLFPEPPRWSTMNTSMSSIQDQSTNDLRPPPPIADNGSRLSFGEAAPRTSHASSRASHRETQRSPSQQSGSVTALPEQAESEKPNTYWETRKDLFPVRTTSKKGNVLRKKSLKKTESGTSALS